LHLGFSPDVDLEILLPTEEAAKIQQFREKTEVTHVVLRAHRWQLIGVQSANHCFTIASLGSFENEYKR